MRRHLWTLAVLALVIASCGTGAEPEATETTSPATDTTAPTETTGTETEETQPEEFLEATLLVVNNMAHLPVFVAQEFGLWADRGLNMNVETLGSGADIAAGLEAGQAEFGAVNAATGVAPQRASGLLTKLVVPYNNDATNAKYVDWIGMLGRVDRGLSTDPQSVVGKQVGVTGGGTPRAYLTEWLIQNELTEDDIEIVTMDPPDMVPALVNGDVDVVVPWEPFRIAALRRLGDNAVEVSPGEPLVLSTIGLGAIDGQIEDNPEIFRLMIEGLVEATQIVRQDPEGVAPVVLSFIDGIEEDEAIAAMARNKYDPRVSVCTRNGVEVTAAQLVEAGRFEGEFTADDLIDTSILDEVLADHPEWIEDLPPLPDNVEDCEGFEE